MASVVYVTVTGWWEWGARVAAASVCEQARMRDVRELALSESKSVLCCTQGAR